MQIDIHRRGAEEERRVSAEDDSDLTHAHTLSLCPLGGSSAPAAAGESFPLLNLTDYTLGSCARC